MKQKQKALTILLFFLILPLLFSILFLGLLHPEYSITLYTDNIVGEGICVTTLCSQESFSPFFQQGFYFGSELKKATIEGYHYDVDEIEFTISDITDAELDGFDLSVFGIKIGHYELESMIPSSEFEGVTISLTEDGQRAHIHLDDPDAGLTFAIKSHFAPVWFWLLYFGVMCAAAFLLSIVLVPLTERWPIILRLLCTASAVAVPLLAGCFFCNSLPYTTFTYFFLNWLLLFAVALGLNALTLPWLGTVLTMTFTTFAYVVNFFVILLRNKPVMPADLKAAGTAVEVMGGYTFTPSWKLVLGVIVVIAYTVVLVRVFHATRSREEQLAKRILSHRVIPLAVAAVCVLVTLNTSTYKSLETFAWDAMLLKSFHREGMVITFLNNAMNSGVKRPEDYSAEAVDGYLADYISAKSRQENGIRPTNIIMVMNEAFSDLRNVGLDERIDVMPFIDSLNDNTLEGSLYVSVFGGGTCNTEFEGLTGNTLAFMDAGAYPYTENVTKPLFSLASYFRDIGYTTKAFHANEPQNWNRNMVYPNLGFDEFHSIEDYPPFSDETWLHGHPADIADYLYMESVDEKHKATPRFLFNVTMQNHSGYERWEDVERVDSVEEYGSGLYLDTQIYLSLIKASDDEVKQLIETYQNSEEPTMIVFFGDHQPGLPLVAREEIYTGAQNIIDSFKTKFFIWTNYETETQHDVTISANYLPWLILERGNFPLPPYVRMLKEVHEKYPVISSQGVIDSNGKIYVSVKDLVDDPLIQKYQFVQYANMFDEIDPEWFEAK